MAFTFLDGNVPLAISSGVGSGEVDISDASEAVFRGFDLELSRLDLRTPEFLFGGFPRHGGWMSGRAHLDSLWRDVRFSEADFMLHRGNEPPSHFLGRGRITDASPFVRFELDLRAQPISFSELALAYPGFPLRGVMDGSIVAVGTMDRMDLRLNLRGDAGAFRFDGTADYAAPGYGARGSADITDLDLRKLLGRDGIPATRLSAAFNGALNGDSLANLNGAVSVGVRTASVDVLRMADSHLALRFGGGRVTIDSVAVKSNAGLFSLKGGAMGLTRDNGDSALAHLEIDSLRVISRILASRGLLPHSGGNPSDSLSGTLLFDGFIGGSVLSPSLRGSLFGRQVSYEGHSTRMVGGEIALTNLFTAGVGGMASLIFDSSFVSGVSLSDAHASVSIDPGVKSSFGLRMNTPDGAWALIKGGSRTSGDTTHFRIDSLSVNLSSNLWALTSQGRITGIAGGYSIENLELRGPRNARFSAAGVLPKSGALDVRVLAENLPMADLERMARIRSSVDGIGEMELLVTGTRDSPALSLNASVDSAGIGDRRLERLTVEARYRDRVASAEIGLYHGGGRAASIIAQLPLDLRLERTATRLPDEAISGRIIANNVPVGMLEAMFPQIRESEGRFTSNLAIGGTLKAPRFFGDLRVDGASTYLPGLGVQLRRVNADIAFTGDSAVIRRLSGGYDGGAAGDTMSVSGLVAFRDYGDPEFNLQFYARDFRAVHLSRVADLYVNSGLQLSGSLRGSTLSGYVSVDKGALYIPELAQKRLMELRYIDSTLIGNREFAPPVPSALLQNLELRNVRVTVGDQVWLRSVESDASIQLGGEISMTSVKVARSAVSGGGSRGSLARPDSVYRLALEGTLNADRGEYRLDLGVVQRKFQVEPGGTVSFYGETELNPTLNISAVYNVRRFSGQDAGRDVRVRVHLTGTLANPQVDFESVDGLDLSTSDLISYLVTGAPSFELGAAGNEHLRAAFDILVPSLGTFLGDRFVGGKFDQFQLELAPLGASERIGDNLGDVFKRTRVQVGKQLGSRTFISANTNLCQLGGLLEGESSTPQELVQSFGVKLEQRLNSGFSLALSAEPSTAALRCAPTGTTARGIISSPPQLGFDLFKIWRFW
jgi:translocation and assembly module TamB